MLFIAGDAQAAMPTPNTRQAPSAAVAAHRARLMIDDRMGRAWAFHAALRLRGAA